MIRTGAINWSNPIAKTGLNDGLVSWWLARGGRVGGGTFFDLCGRNHASFAASTASPTWSGNHRQGGNYAVLLDGSNDYFSCADSSSLDVAAGDFSVCGWAYYTGGSSNRVHVGRNWPKWELRELGGQLYSDVGGISLGPAGTITVSTWNHVALVRASGVTNGTAIYLNGQSVATGTNSTSLTTTNTMYFGCRTGNLQFAAGLLDDWRFYVGRALSQSDIQALISDSLAGYPLTLNRITRRVGNTVGGGGGATIPLFVHHYRMQGAA